MKKENEIITKSSDNVFADLVNIPVTTSTKPEGI